MEPKELEIFKDHRVRLTFQFKNGQTAFYTGSIVELKENTVVFLDKYKNLVVLELQYVVKAETFSEELEEQLVDKRNGNSDSAG